MKIDFLGMHAEVPDTWTDRSTLTWTIPAAPHLGAPLAGAAQRADSPGNVVINWVPLRPDGIQASVAAQAAQMPSLFPEFSWIEQGEIDGMPLLECRYTTGRAIRQIMLFKAVGSRLLITTGTALEEVFSGVREAFIEVARSLR